MVDGGVSGGLNAGSSSSEERVGTSADLGRWKPGLLWHVDLKHGLNANQVFQWRCLYGHDKLGAPAQRALRLLSVSVVEDQEIPKFKPPEVVPEWCGAIYIGLPGEVWISLRRQR